MDITMISYEAWQELEKHYPEAAQFLDAAAIAGEIECLEKRATLTSDSEHEKEIAQRIFDLREKLSAEKEYLKAAPATNTDKEAGCLEA